jgi:group I intron endonuclease
MPIKKGTCGIYSITTPNGNTYVGSSICVERRFVEHKSMLKRNCHHSNRLQKAYNRHGDGLVFKIIHVCETKDLLVCESEFMKKLNAKLNVAQEVNNVWLNPESRAKMEKTKSTKEWKENRSRIAKATNMSSRWRAVECSNGNVYKNLTDTANAFGVRAAHIAAMIKSGQNGRKIKVRFKYLDEKWSSELSIPERIQATKIKNGTVKMSDEARRNMSNAKKGKQLPTKTQAAAIQASSIPVMGVSVATRETVIYPSSMEAGRKHGNGVTRTAASQINKCIRGVKKSAYGYKWSYANA